jgi:hypothetical protein
MAQIYAGVRLLPLNHPYLDPANKGRFNVLLVMKEASKNLKFSKSNIDQIIVYFALLAGFVVLIMQFAVLAMLILKHFIGQAHAQLYPAIFSTGGCAPTGGNCVDIAYQLLDIVFAVPGFFGSTFDPNVIGGIPPYNQALHALFEFYSLAILIIAVLVFLYYVVLMVGETAQTGTPFGRRFQHIWAPARLVIALGLLVPINYGLNTAQYITLAAARAGSSMATNGWILFNQTADNPTDMASGTGIGALFGASSPLLARMKAPDFAPVVEFMALVKTCQWAYEYAYGGQISIQPYHIYQTDVGGGIYEWQSTPGIPSSLRPRTGLLDSGIEIKTQTPGTKIM